MTEPTWKDPLLAEWWEGCSADEQEQLGKTLDMFLDAQATPAGTLDHLAGLAICNFAVDRLRSLIDAELARGREAVEMLRELEWSGKSTNGGYPCCPECDGIWDVREKYPDHEPIPKWAGTIGHAPDCRLAKVIGGKP